MNRLLAGLCVTAALSAGCASNSANSPPARDTVAAAAAAKEKQKPSADAGETQLMSSAAPDPVAARIGNRAITTGRLMEPLLADQGLNVLLHLVQLELAKANAESRGVTVSPGDVSDERERTLERMLATAEQKSREQIEELRNAKKDAEADKIEAEMRQQRPALLGRVLAQQFVQTGQYVSPQQFDLAIETNAYLRKIAEPLLEEKITEDLLQKRFAAQYGEKAVVRHIQGTNAREVAQALERYRQAARIIDAQGGASEKERRQKKVAVFADLAQQVSRNAETAKVGGQLSPFTVNETALPQNFKDVAFALEPGEVSDPVHAGPHYHLILLEDKLRPKAVEYGDVREALRDDVRELLVQAQVKDWRERFAAHIMKELRVEQPLLREKFDEFTKKMLENQAKLREQQKITDAMEADRAAEVADDGGGAGGRKLGTGGAATKPAPRTKPGKAPATRTAPKPRPGGDGSEDPS